jgi:hypothetical protein
MAEPLPQGRLSLGRASPSKLEARAPLRLLRCGCNDRRDGVATGFRPAGKASRCLRRPLSANPRAIRCDEKGFASQTKKPDGLKRTEIKFER